MSEPEHESLTAALRRLADEHATGLLSVAVSDSRVVIELAQGTPVAIGPVHDVTGRTGDDAAAELVTTAVVDDLVEQTVAAVVTGATDWDWDVDSSVDRVPLPAGLVPELSRRAVDAAQALSTLQPGTVLTQANAVPTSGELDRARRLFDGNRSLADVAETLDLPLPTVATMAAALVRGGALAVESADDEDTPPARSWSEAVAAADVEDEDEEEPELWVMEPIEDDDDPEAIDAGDPTDGGDRAATTIGADEQAPEPADDEAVEQPAAATPAPSWTDPDWNDTAWLDELSPLETEEQDPPVLAAGDDDIGARAALGSMLNELQQDSPAPRRAPDRRADAAVPDAEPPADGPAGAEPGDAEDGTGADGAVGRHEPKAEPGDVAEFLRELSRLALDDD